jgi:hypothetical protein
MTSLETLDRIVDVLKSRPLPHNQLQLNVRYALTVAITRGVDAGAGVEQVRQAYQVWMRRTAQVCDDQTEMLLADIGMALEASGM